MARHWYANTDPRPRGRIFARRVLGGSLSWLATTSSFVETYGMRSIDTNAARSFDTLEEAYAFAISLLNPTEPPC